MRRRDAIRTLGALGLAVTAGCASGPAPPQLASVWSGREHAAFLDALHRSGVSARTFSIGDDLGALLSSQVAPAVVPDVAIVPQPGLVRDSSAWLHPIDSRDPGDWRDLLTSEGRTYGAWFKVTFKSLIWHRDLPSSPAPGWTGLVRWLSKMAADGKAPLSLGAADGWVLTDWFENVLLGLDVAAYRDLAAGKGDWGGSAVLTALEQLGELWQVPGLFPNGPRRALVTQFEDSVIDVFARGRGLLVAGADTAWPIIERFGRHRAAWIRFPSDADQPALVGGDAAVLLKPTETGRQLISDLRTRVAPAWAATGGLLPLTPSPPATPAALRADRFWNDLLTGEFDLSDRLRGRLATGEGKGSWAIFKDFFAQVAIDRIGPGPAARAAVARLKEAAGAA